jgi:predicted acyltransferase
VLAEVAVNRAQPFERERMEELPVSDTPSQRVTSIDALRGFDMFWIIGGEGIFRSLHTIFNHPTTVWISKQLPHVKWEGFHFYDLIFALFLFLAGAALPFSISRRQERGESLGRLYVHIVKRTAVLILLGLIYERLLEFKFAEMRWSAVLTMIGLSYFFAAIIILNTSIRMQAVLAAGLLLCYWAALSLISVQMTKDATVVSFGAGDYTIQGNLISFLDQVLLPGKHPYGGVTLGVGPFLTITGAATVLIGSLAGRWMRSKRSGNRIVLGMVLAGVASLFAGYIWGEFFPIIKLIWTSSFVLVACGWSLLLLALFYWVIDVGGHRKWAFFFIVIGMNPITIYFLQEFVDFGRMSSFFLTGVSEHAGMIGPLILSFGVVMVKWLFLWFLYRHKMFFRV